MGNSGVVLGVGELLWDVFADGKHLGGAPVNFAYHCGQMGYAAKPVSRVGRDELGDEILAELRAKGVAGDFVQVDDVKATGTVIVEMDDRGGHSFTICEDVAWDYIMADEAIMAEARGAAAICFGTLGQRCEVSRRAILSIVGECAGLKVYDINLRQNFFTREIIEVSLEAADVLKLNDDEIWVVRDLLGIDGEGMAEVCKAILERFELRLVCVTRGAEGALLVSGDEVVSEAGGGSEVKVVDTVGCGDAFCATMVVGLLRGWSLRVVAERANRVGAMVAGMAGGTPAWSTEMLAELGI